MRLSQYALGLGAVAASVLAAPAGTAACSSNKVIDNFSKFADRTNSLGAVMGDDKSMTSISATGTTLTFNPAAKSYIFENFPCENAASEGYNAVSFTLSGPTQSSLMMELQTRASCTATEVKRTYRNVTVPATSGTVTVPLKDFEGANLAAITTISWSTFNKTGSAYSLGNVQFVCQK